VDKRTEFPTDVKKVKNTNDKDGDDETVEDSSVWDPRRDEADNEASKEQHDDDGVNNVPHVGVKHTQLLTELGRFTDEELAHDTSRQHHTRWQHNQ